MRSIQLVARKQKNEHSGMHKKNGFPSHIHQPLGDHIFLDTFFLLIKCFVSKNISKVRNINITPELPVPVF